MHQTIRKGLTVRTIHALVQAAKPGMWSHENGLCLAVAKSGSAFWALRYSTRTGKRRLMTLETYEPIDVAKLKALEWKAAEHRKQIKAGHDPLEQRSFSTTKAIAKRAGDETFEDVAREYIAQHKDGWKNAKHHQQWENTLATYAYPIIGKMLPHEISTDDVLNVIRQDHARKGSNGTLWANARETASRVRSRIEIIIAAAKAKGLSNRDARERWVNHHNPAQWQDNLEHWLNGKQSKAHFEAMDWKDAPAFVRALQEKPDYSAKALALTILCAVRTNETINATWPEFDLDNAIWTIPGERMKAGVEHRVPLSNAAVNLLNSLHRIDGNPYVFPGAKRNQPLSNMAMLEMLRGMRAGITVHGFRSTFRDWTSETTLHPDTIAEMALAHTIKDKTQKAYRRGDALERRKDLMQQWSDYLLMGAGVYSQKWQRLLA
ncbi:tyrosine-type recombinase/integrase [Bradyrhizobium sp. 44]|uniref:tyrosine-type recombinase/integrase n=1 Tax=Bradyrhizobium sp. 44 TaxID=2782675 RepID=UPI001FFAFA17|nr:site-specific integrase [Bradyrhizobium sp. 44]MCK1286574.1 tyrosine-type recombinase/integrase [Bradyrhizobium sp. 44]